MNVLVFAGGPRPSVPPAPSFEPDLVIGCDAGASHATSFGWHLDLIVGDFDSLEAGFADSLPYEVEQMRFDADKDATDLELGLDVAMTRGASRIWVALTAAGRFDHALGAALGLARPTLLDAELTASIDGSLCSVVATRPRRLDRADGSTVSLIPAGAEAVSVSIGGVRWPLDHAELPHNHTLGISNEIVEDAARVEVHSGAVLAIQSDE